MLELKTEASVGGGLGVWEAIHRRRSVRAYTGQPVAREDVLRLLDAAVQAPTAMLEEPLAFAVVQDRRTLERLSARALDLLPELRPRGAAAAGFIPPADVFHGAGTLIVIYGKPLGPFVAADCWLAAENLMLAACGLGLGTCVIGLALSALNEPAWRAELGAPPGAYAHAPIVVGAPAEETPAPGRRAPEIVSWRTPLSA
ncbi:MAG: nitroreductase family protein [Elusimicrobia bacterium]|nr:nitroreductase family protein [Elusimicrobiota bacterium]